MKTLFHCLILLAFSSRLFSQESPERIVKTDISEVTVFLEGAQVVRSKTIDLPAGESVIKFTGLSPFLDKKSLQVKAGGQVTVLSVNHQYNYLEYIEKPKELTALEASLKETDASIKLEKTFLDIITEELAFLHDNRDVTGSLKETNVTGLRDMSTYYGEKLKSLKMQEIDHQNKMSELAERKADLAGQINTLSGTKKFAPSEILIKVKAASPARADFEISYLVGNAGWFPSYDVRAKSINDPIRLVYKANVRQDTKEDWKNVKLRFSSSDPNKTGLAPSLKTYFLNYNTIPPVYNRTVSQVTGRITDDNGEALAGAYVKVEGTSIGTVADAGGNYSISIPNMGGNLVFSYIGCSTQTLPVTGPVINVSLPYAVTSLDEIVVVGYGTAPGSRSGLEIFDNDAASPSERKAREPRAKENISMAEPALIVENQTTVNFEIKSPYTILSDNKSYSVDMEIYDLPADYQYYCAPKIEPDAFLMANISGWEKYNLLEGEASLYFEDTYIGKSLLDVRYASDTLHISLGRDKNVVVSRTRVKDFSNRQFLGSRKVESRDWLITVKNNKNQKINMLIFDQVPVSTLEEIEVELQDISGAVHNKDTGEMKWIFALDPAQKKDFNLKYSVKYPKFRNLVVE